MKCPVCMATWEMSEGHRCPQCHADVDALTDSAEILLARERFQNKLTSFAPIQHIPTGIKLGPWIGTAMGFLFFVFWMASCSHFVHF